MMDIDGLKPYYSYFEFDKERRLAWCNDALACALSYYRSKTGKPTSYTELTSHFDDVETVKALIFGALVAGDTIRTPGELDAIWDDARFPGYVGAMVEGMTHYLPPKEIVDDLTEDLNEEYPETRQSVEVEKDESDMDFHNHFTALLSRGLSADDIGQMTLRNMINHINALSGVVTDWEDIDG